MTARFRPQARYTKPGDDGMNRTERAYRDYLELLRRAGEIVEYAREPEKFRLADSTFYTPDFRVLEVDGTITFIDVKGFWHDDARVKIKVAAEMHPYRFAAATRKGKGWQHEYFNGTKGDRP